MLKVPALTVPVKVLPFTLKVTLSPSWAEPPTVPVTFTRVGTSEVLMASSAVMLASSVMVGNCGAVTTKGCTVVPQLP